MAPVTRRQRVSTLIDRGLGLLEAMLPRRGIGTTALSLPPGQRDDSGFWFPAGFGRPADIFTPQQRALQAKQRSVQRSRLRPDQPAPPAESGGTAAADPQALEVCLPLPAPRSEAGEALPGPASPVGLDRASLTPAGLPNNIGAHAGQRHQTGPALHRRPVG